MAGDIDEDDLEAELAGLEEEWDAEEEADGASYLLPDAGTGEMDDVAAGGGAVPVAAGAGGGAGAADAYGLPVAPATTG